MNQTDRNITDLFNAFKSRAEADKTHQGTIHEDKMYQLGRDGQFDLFVAFMHTDLVRLGLVKSEAK